MLTLHHALRTTLAGSCSWTLASAPAPRRTIRSDSSQDHWEMLCLDICPVLRPKQSTECWALYLSHLLERGQLQVWVWASALIQLCWFRSQRGAVKGNISVIVFPPRMGHKPSKQMHNTRTKLYLGSRRNLRKFHSRPISLPGSWLAPESAPFWLLLAQECRKESVCKVYWPD